ncbi:MAG: hypothetical protein J6R85_05445, partial [Lentisphaeria bacterium]|nr:hypothetical protein [Lentisphaeria bacterium]
PYKFTIPTKKEVMYDAKLLQAVSAKAFYYLMTSEKAIGSEAVKLITDYLSCVNFGNGQDICRKTGESFYVAAQVYDWCYPLLTDADKKLIRDRFYWLAVEMETSWPPFQEPASYGHGNEAQVSRDLLAISIAMYDEDPLPYQYVSWKMLKDLQPVKRHLYRSGMHDQGTAYGAVRFRWDLFGALQFRRSMNYELLGEETGKVPYYWFYLRLPDSLFFHQGDTRIGRRYPGSTDVALLACALWPDPKIKGEYQKIAPPRAVPEDPILFLLLNDPELKADPERSDLPLARFFGEPFEMMIARTGWNLGRTADDVSVVMFAPGYHSRNHQHLDAGSFQIYYRGVPATDIGQYGYYGSAYDWNFNKSSVSHSVMLFYDPDQKTRLMGEQYDLNSGTQEIIGWWPPAMLDELLTDKYRNADLLGAGFGPDPVKPTYAFLSSDLTRLYPGRTSRYSRTMVFRNFNRKDIPGILLVYDRYNTAKAQVKPIFQLVTLCEPQQKNADVVIPCADYGRSSKLTLRPLSPAAPETTILSGDAAYTIDGVRLNLKRPNVNETTGSRIQFAGGKNHALQAILIQDGSAETPEIPLQKLADGRFAIPLFDTLTILGAPEKASDSAEFTLTAETKVLILDLKPGKYALSCDSKTLGSVTVAEKDGSFYAELPAGKYSIAPTAQTLPEVITKATPAIPVKADRHALYLDDQRIPGKVAGQNNKLTLPVTALLKAKNIPFTDDGKTLRFRTDAGEIVLAANSADVQIGTLKRTMPIAAKRSENGDWIISGFWAADLLNLDLYPDEWTVSAAFRSRSKAPVAQLHTITDGSVEDWTSLIEKGIGVWIGKGRDVVGEIVFPAPRPVKALHCKWIAGDSRVMKFKVEGSADGNTFETIFDGTSSGKSAFPEITPVKPGTYRAIRIHFGGNQSSFMNALQELKFL